MFRKQFKARRLWKQAEELETALTIYSRAIAVCEEIIRLSDDQELKDSMEAKKFAMQSAVLDIELRQEGILAELVRL